MYRGVTLKAGQTAEYALGIDRKAYLVPAVGAIEANGVRISARDGAAIDATELLKITALEDAEVVLVDLARSLQIRPRCEHWAVLFQDNEPLERTCRK